MFTLTFGRLNTVESKILDTLVFLMQKNEIIYNITNKPTQKQN